jgi:hypothetical protein
VPVLFNSPGRSYFNAHTYLSIFDVIKIFMSNSWSSDSVKKLDTLEKMYQLLIVQSLFWIEKELNLGPSALMLSTLTITRQKRSMVFRILE